jgi:hypothetical protein
MRPLVLAAFVGSVIWRVAIITFAVAGLTIGQARLAFATQTKVPTDWSFYVQTTSTTTAYNLGCNQGNFDKSYSPPLDSVVILDFGGQYEDGSGTQMIPNGPKITNAQIQTFAESFAQGYWICTGSDTTSVLQLGIGTNNSYYGVDSTGGTNWQNQVLTIKNYVQAQGWQSQVSIGGANDFERGFHANYADVKAWMDAFVLNYLSWFVNYGSCDGCSWTRSNDVCQGSWCQHGYYYLSWGASPAYATPEIYVNGNQQQWQMISLYGATHAGTIGEILFSGPFDGEALYPGDYSSTNAWNVFWNRLNGDSRTACNFTYSLEIHNAT